MSTEQHKFEGKGPELYERKSVARYFGPLARDFLKQVPLNQGDRLLDVACGTGIVARVAAERLGPDGLVRGIDINPDMLEVARSLTPEGGAKFEWHEGDAANMPFEDGEFDVVLCQQGLQFIPDKLGAISEMYRVLSDGGWLGICVWRSIEHSPYNLAKAEALGRHVSQERGEIERRRTPFALGGADLLQELIEDAGFRDVRIRALELDINMGNPNEVVSVESFSDLELEVAEKVVRDVHETLQPYTTAEGIVIPLRYHLALAQK